MGELVVCDGDVVERSNLNRQFLYGMDDLTKPKASAAGVRLRALNQDVKVTPIIAEIDRASAPELIKGADLYSSEAHIMPNEDESFRSWIEEQMGDVDMPDLGE